MKSTKKTIILAAIETSYGSTTDPFTTSSQNPAIEALEAFNAEITPLQSENIDSNPLRNFFTAPKPISTKHSVSCRFSIELSVNGTRGTIPNCDKILQACAMVRTTSSTGIFYKPTSTNFKSLAIYYFIDGLLHKIRGARGSFNIEISAGNIPKMNFEITGLYSEPLTQAPPNISYSNLPTGKPANPANTNIIQLDNNHLNAASLDIDIGNKVINNMGLNNQEIIITERKPTINLAIEVGHPVTFNPFSKISNNSKQHLIFQQGNSAGNIIRIETSKAATEALSYKDENSILMQNLKMTPLPSQGDDELKISFR